MLAAPVVLAEMAQWHGGERPELGPGCHWKGGLVIPLALLSRVGVVGYVAERGTNPLKRNVSVDPKGECAWCLINAVTGDVNPIVRFRDYTPSADYEQAELPVLVSNPQTLRK